jgi:hypothetical protein
MELSGKIHSSRKSHTELQHIYLCRSCTSTTWSFLLQTGCKVICTESQSIQLGLRPTLGGSRKDNHMVHKHHFLTHSGQMPSDLKWKLIIDKYSPSTVRMWWKYTQKYTKCWAIILYRWPSICRKRLLRNCSIWKRNTLQHGRNVTKFWRNLEYNVLI